MNRVRGRMAPVRPSGWVAELAAIRAAEAAQQNGPEVSFPEKTALQYRKWSLIHEILQKRPFHVSEQLSRHGQWTRVRDYIIQEIAEPEIVDWLTQQIDIARHIAQGVSDLRPRKNGPCHAVLTEWIAARAHKALAVHRWALAADAADVPLYTEHFHPTGTTGHPREEGS